jgi:2-oxoisovalerate dehydrogenase E1 component alpha subunit
MVATANSALQVAAGEEGTIVGSSSALMPDDVIFAQYREAGVLQQRGFGLDEFMANFFSNRKDLSKGRNMPNHFASRRLNVVCCPALQLPRGYSGDMLRRS